MPTMGGIAPMANIRFSFVVVNKKKKISLLTLEPHNKSHIRTIMQFMHIR